MMNDDDDDDDDETNLVTSSRGQAIFQEIFIL